MRAMLRRKLWSTRRRKLITTTGGLFVTIVAVAVAAWLTQGEGPGSGKIGSLQPLVVLAGPTPNSACVPGGTCDAAVRVSNQNGPLTLVAVSDSQAVGPTGFTAGCPEGNVSVSEKAGLAIPLAGGEVTELTLADVFALRADAPTSCQGISFSRALKLVASTP